MFDGKLKTEHKKNTDQLASVSFYFLKNFSLI